jgi:NAD(P)-dependent dehydrogenase (short-subunit alcohol dehydrogenase family)
MKNLKIVVFGGSGGLGSKVSEKLKENYEVLPLSSKDLDVTNFKEVQEFFKKNHYDVLINLSGLNYDKFTHKIQIDDIEKIDRVIDVNIKGNINVVSSSLPSMRNNNFGRIILISSVLAEKPVLATSVYSGCKGFIDSFTKTVALENANKNITCNSIQLGYFDGGLTHRIPNENLENIKSNIPTGRFGTISELYNTILFLVETPYINGISLKLNGGIDF